MTTIMILLAVSQLVFTIIAGLYFYESLKSQNSTKNIVSIDSKNEVERLKKLRSIQLTKPLSEKTRPETLESIVGQEKGIKALKAVLCSPNPQHVIIYGPPGVGKTAAARLILEEAKKRHNSPFSSEAKFIEIDATTLRFDERSVADPLIGSVHDPIYQGAGAFGPAGIPQPKEGAVTKAHGGVLFIDEIGELHPIQMNKLLKVLEDRAVYMTSSYYSPTNTNIPKYIHDIFKNGMPADFRLVGATTRSPEDIPQALRSRCTEIFFDGLDAFHVKTIGKNAVKHAGFLCEDAAIDKISEYATNGRETVNIIQTASSLAEMEGRNKITLDDVMWVIDSGRYVPKMIKKVSDKPKIGYVNGLAVYGSDKGALLEIEATAIKLFNNEEGKIHVTGIVEEEEIKNRMGMVKRKSNIMSSVENVITCFEKLTGVCLKNYNIHINFPGGSPVDGPSAGIAIFCALYSAVFEKYISPKLSMTGEISIHGNVLAVGGVDKKIQAAKEAGADFVIIPKENGIKKYDCIGVQVVAVSNISDVVNIVFGTNEEIHDNSIDKNITENINIMTAKGF